MNTRSATFPFVAQAATTYSCNHVIWSFIIFKSGSRTRASWITIIPTSHRLRMYNPTALLELFNSSELIRYGGHLIWNLKIALIGWCQPSAYFVCFFVTVFVMVHAFAKTTRGTVFELIVGNSTDDFFRKMCHHLWPYHHFLYDCILKRFILRMLIVYFSSSWVMVLDRYIL